MIDDGSVQISPVPSVVDQQAAQVLIIEDESAMAKAIQRTLRRSRCNTVVAQDGFQAGCMLEKMIPSLVILDLSMPGLNGFDVLRYIRHQPALVEIPVLVLSALPDSQLQRAMDLGATEVMSKPFDNMQLQQSIARLLHAAGVADD
ncbi:MAG: response regulator [Marinobacterium sp.]|nr:response regulator [Marinobacterium sp.]